MHDHVTACVFTTLAAPLACAQLAPIEAEPAADGQVDPWADFPTERTLEFSGHTWRVKGSTPDVTYGPGGFPFNPTADGVWVDDDGRLHLRVTQVDGQWHSAEVRLTEPLGHGDYRFTVAGRVDDLDPNLVFGLFLWEYQPSYEGIESSNVANEFDIEFGTWKDPDRAPAQFVCQPWQREGNIMPYRFELDGDDALSTHAFRWRPDGLDARAWHGGPAAEQDPDAQIVALTYDGPDVPQGSPHVHLNLWCIHEPPARGTPQTVVIDHFEFVPLDE